MLQTALAHVCMCVSGVVTASMCSLYEDPRYNGRGKDSGIVIVSTHLGVKPFSFLR